MIYAQIKNLVVQNTIVVDDLTLLDLFIVNFDYLVPIDSISPQPGPDWTYDPGLNTFTAPVYPDNEPTE